jgi:hypothetical protein
MFSGAFPDAGYKILNDRIVDVGFQQRQTNLAHGSVNIPLG